VVPEPVPRSALAAAVVTLAALASVVVLAPRLAPAPAAVATDDEPMQAVAARSGEIAPRAVRGGTEVRGEPGSFSTAVPDRAEETTVARALQRRIRRKLWGDEPAEAPTRPSRGRSGPGAETADAARENSWQAAKGVVPHERRRPRREESPPPSQLEAAGDDGAEAAAQTPENAAARAGADGGGASGAGSGTDPTLYGAAREPDEGTSGHFELGITARVRTRRAAVNPPTGDTPPAAPDEHPALGPRQRTEVAVRRMIVPPAYEPVVRRMFAQAEEGTP
jgi:hypothetical protein